ncbi:MAG: hypothetical protein AAF713_10020 [Pseudomonadota bacterium]
MLEVEIDLARLTLRRIVFVEHNLKRAQRLSETLAKRHRQEASRFHDQLERPPVQAPAPKTDRDGSGQRFVPGTQFARVQVEAFGPASEEKPKLFIAMPFADEHRDEYDIAFLEAAHGNGFVCERLDLAQYTGDVVVEIERRIRAADGMIALLNDLNLNVFLEVGYAMALGRPIIFVVRAGTEVPFDIRNHRRIEYTRIAPLRQELTTLLAELKTNGAL